VHVEAIIAVRQWEVVGSLAAEVALDDIPRDTRRDIGEVVALAIGPREAVVMHAGNTLVPIDG